MATMVLTIICVVAITAMAVILVNEFSKSKSLGVVIGLVISGLTIYASHVVAVQ